MSFGEYPSVDNFHMFIYVHIYNVHYICTFQTITPVKKNRSNMTFGQNVYFDILKDDFEDG